MKSVFNFFRRLKTWVKIAIIGIPTIFLIYSFVLKPKKITPTSEIETKLVEQLNSTENQIEESPNDTLLFLLNFEEIKDEVIKNFVDRFLNTAIVEKYKFNIPISIKLAQGIVESNCGRSRLAKKAHNYFGHKCVTRCKTCDGKSWKIVNGCINVHDDGRDDLFRMYPSAWHSWRGQSILLTSTRYSKLLKLDPKEYKKWAYGLKKAGYATSKKYAEVLINRIETHKLNKYDEVDLYELAKSRGIDLTKIKKGI